MKYENASPKVAFTPDGEVLFFNAENVLIKDLKKMTEGQFREFLNNNEIKHVGTFSVFSFGPSSPCKLIWRLPDGTPICFWADCETYQYLGQC